MEPKRSTDSGHGAGAMVVEWIVCSTMVAVMAMWFLSWASGVLSRAAHETGKKIEFVPPNDR